MKYREMVKFLNDNDILAIQPIIADYVSTQLETDVDDDEFETICQEIFNQYLDCDEEPDLWLLVAEYLTNKED